MSAQIKTASERLSLKLQGGEVSCLHWRASGIRRPAMHFAHANGFNALTYRAILERAADRFEIWASDLRGHGQTTLHADPERHPGWSIYAQDLVSLIERIGAGPMVLAGHSMGATASLLAAIRRPDLVCGLVLCDPVVFGPAAHAIGAGMRALGLFDRVVPIARQAERRRAEFAGPEHAFQAYRGRGAFKTWPDEMVRDYLTGGLLQAEEGGPWRLACRPEWEAANYRSAPPFIWHRLGRVRCPTVLLTAAKGSTCRAPAPQLLSLRLARCRWEQVPETSHFLPMEAPDSVLAALESIVTAGG